MSVLFVSDLHLSAERPAQLELFLEFLAKAREASALYVLGDLFEVWLGDDDTTPPHPRVAAALKALSDAGVALNVGLGNRDFLLGRRFARATGARLMADWEIVELGGRRTLLTHGDLLCTKDVKYQKFRRLVRNPVIRAAFLAAPLGLRRRIALGTQAGTKASMRGKADAIMDVDERAVAEALTRHAATQLVHGHTHRPAVHEFELDDRPCRRIVLGDWYEQDSVLVCDDEPRPMRVSDYLGKL